MGERSDAAYWNWSESSEKFDYYITGLITAVLVFAINDLPSEPVRVSPQGVGVLAVVCLLVSVACGLKRIEHIVLLKGLGQRRIHNQEKIGEMNQPFTADVAYNRATGEYYSPEMLKLEISLSLEEVKVLSDAEHRQIKKSGRYYRARNLFFGAGLLLLVAAKVWLGYAADANIYRGIPEFLVFAV